VVEHVEASGATMGLPRDATGKSARDSLDVR
jgi:hypothetical protein